MKELRWRELKKFHNGERLSRKEKKRVLGTKVSRNRIRKEVEAGELFHCPKCRHILRIRSTGNMVAYPEWWEYWYCGHCGLTTSGADNCKPVSLLSAAIFLKENPEMNDLEKEFKSVYDAMVYISDDLKDFI